MNYTGLIIGVATFLCIGLFHPLVIKAEYYFGVGCWWVFLVLGLICIGGSLWVEDTILSTLFGVTAFSSLWSILEIFKQRERVMKGWFPENPKRKNKYNDQA